METFITSYCTLRSNRIKVGGMLVYEDQAGKELSEFLSGAYKNLPVSYPKFHKMDRLSKLGILASEYCLKNCEEWEKEEKKDIALLFSNCSSSLDSDRIHAKSLTDKKNYFPSPSVFVYTLPNIVLGEIAIKHGLSGENAFFVTERFDAHLMYTYATLLLKSTDTKYLLAGWLNVDGNDYEGFVYCIKRGNFRDEKTGHKLNHSPQQLLQLYKS